MAHEDKLLVEVLTDLITQALAGVITIPRFKYDTEGAVAEWKRWKEKQS